MLKAAKHPSIPPPLEENALRCVGHLLRDHAMVTTFLAKEDGLNIVLPRDLSTGKVVRGSVAALRRHGAGAARHVKSILKRVFEDPATLLAAMESEIRRAVTTLVEREKARSGGGGGRTLNPKH